MRGLREVPIVDDEGRILGPLDGQEASAARIAASEPTMKRPRA